jgi:hypothetical protein
MDLRRGGKEKENDRESAIKRQIHNICASRVYNNMY